MLTSCEGIVGGDGKIYSSTTKEPLDSVEVMLYLNGHPQELTYSDSTGFFRGSEFVGCVPSCPDAIVKLKKNGFETMTIDFKKFWKENEFNSQTRDNMKIFLTPIK